MSIALNVLGRALEGRRIQMVVPACCAIVTVGAFPASAYGVPLVSSTFASAAAVGTGLARAARMNDEPTRVVCWAGDGGTYDIGMAAVSAAAERNEDLLYVCYDNEIYGNTGGQRSSATPPGATTTTTPRGKLLEKKDILGIMAAHRVPYVASLSLAHLDDATRKMQKALDLEGFRFLHLLSPCPTGWKSEPAEGIELIRWAVASGLYPIYEVEANGRHVINIDPEMSDDALARYFAAQGRFRKGQLDLGKIRASIDARWRALRRRATDGEDDDRDA
jgi:pyruvate ferredoxin oxidoreductase beta subunit/2-oxoisovalerate ferredoxin oxidoreductase beta subunit